MIAILTGDMYLVLVLHWVALDVSYSARVNLTLAMREEVCRVGRVKSF